MVVNQPVQLESWKRGECEDLVQELDRILTIPKSSQTQNSCSKNKSKIYFCTIGQFFFFFDICPFEELLNVSGQIKHKKFKCFETVFFGGPFLDQKVIFSWNP